MGSRPEHEKLKALDGKNETIGEFIEWLQGSGFQICHIPPEPEDGWEEDVPASYKENYQPSRFPVSAWIAKFFDIDPEKLESEKRAILDTLREMREE